MAESEDKAQPEQVEDAEVKQEQLEHVDVAEVESEELKLQEIMER